MDAQNADFEAISTATDDELKALGDRWFALLETTDMSVPQNRFRTGLLRLAYSYSRLIALSYGFQHAFGKNTTDENPFLNRVSFAGFWTEAWDLSTLGCIVLECRARRRSRRPRRHLSP